MPLTVVNLGTLSSPTPLMPVIKKITFHVNSTRKLKNTYKLTVEEEA